jgi:hypothetical protein
VDRSKEVFACVATHKRLGSHPIAVALTLNHSESLGPQQRVGEVNQQRRGYERCKRVIENHDGPLRTGWALPIDCTKKSTLVARMIMSSIEMLLTQKGSVE